MIWTFAPVTLELLGIAAYGIGTVLGVIVFGIGLAEIGTMFLHTHL